MSYADIYDFFTPIETAIAAAFTANQVVCFTPTSDPELQKQRPRVECVMSLGAARKQLVGQVGVCATPGFSRDSSRAAQIHLDVVTAASIKVHRDYLAKILYLCDTLAKDANATGTLTRHSIQSISLAGGTSDYTPETGMFITHLIFDIDFSVQADAWTALST